MSAAVLSEIGVLSGTVQRWQACCLIKSISTTTAKCQVFSDARTDIGAATVCGTLRFDDRDTPIQVEGRYEVPPYGANATYMGDYCRTGVNAIIMPGRRIGAYSVVGPGVILYDDVPSKTMVMAKQELITKPWGPERYGW